MKKLNKIIIIISIILLVLSGAGLGFLLEKDKQCNTLGAKIFSLFNKQVRKDCTLVETLLTFSYIVLGLSAIGFGFSVFYKSKN